MNATRRTLAIALSLVLSLGSALAASGSRSSGRGGARGTAVSGSAARGGSAQAGARAGRSFSAGSVRPGGRAISRGAVSGRASGTFRSGFSGGSTVRRPLPATGGSRFRSSDPFRRSTTPVRLRPSGATSIRARPGSSAPIRIRPSSPASGTAVRGSGSSAPARIRPTTPTSGTAVRGSGNAAPVRIRPSAPRPGAPATPGTGAGGRSPAVRSGNAARPPANVMRITTSAGTVIGPPSGSRTGTAVRPTSAGAPVSTDLRPGRELPSGSPAAPGRAVRPTAPPAGGIPARPAPGPSSPGLTVGTATPVIGAGREDFFGGISVGVGTGGLWVGGSFQYGDPGPIHGVRPPYWGPCYRWPGWYPAYYPIWYPVWWGYPYYYPWYPSYGFIYYRPSVVYVVEEGGGAAGAAVSSPELVAPATASIELAVVQKGARVFLDGREIGYVADYRGKKRLEVAPGEHVLELRLEGYQTLRLVFEVDAGSEYLIEEELYRGEGIDPRSAPLPGSEEAAPPAEGPAAAGDAVEMAALQVEPVRGMLTIQASPPDASLFLDGRYLAQAEEMPELAPSLALAPGTHVLEVSRPGYGTETTTFHVGDEPTTVIVALTPEG